MSVKSPRKLIEVALPLDAINEASAKEKSIRHGHPSTLHLWWARRPLAAARAIIFAQMVNDPGYQQGGGFKYGKNKKEAAKERKRLFNIMRELVLWENTQNAAVLQRARDEIERSWREVCEINKDHPDASELFNPEQLPGVHDPFAGGGAIPLEAQRLGLNAFASDLNPVAVLINKAMIEVLPQFAGHSSVNPSSVSERRLVSTELNGAQGLAEDVQFYGGWIQEQAKKRIGHLYPTIRINEEMVKGRPDLKPIVGEDVVVNAWIWARTVKSPNPAFSHVNVPLAPTFLLSSKSEEKAYISPVVQEDEFAFHVKVGDPPASAKRGTKAEGRGANFRCLLSGSPIGADYIRSEAAAGRMGQTLMAVVAQASCGRVFLSAEKHMEELALSAVPDWKPEVEFFTKALGFRIGNYGMHQWSDLYSSRQLVAMTTFCDLVSEVRRKVEADALASGKSEEESKAYANAVSVFLAFAVSRAADYWGRGAIWEPGGMFIAHVFTRNALPMTWDFPEANPFSSASGSWSQTCVDWIVRFLRAQTLSLPPGSAQQANAQEQTISRRKVVSTDPPYYDNIGYADLSDYFYVWLRKSLRDVYPQLFATMTVPKAEELVATPDRHGGRTQAEMFFLDGMTEAMRTVANNCHPAFPVTIYYAFKQSETRADSGTSSTGWETFLDAVISAGLSLRGTWPVRTERPGRMRENSSNALASSVVLVCSPRAQSATAISRREFVRELNRVLPEALDEMTRGSGEEQSPIAPVDLSQAIIGPGMAVFSEYSAVLEADGSAMSVKTALQLVNRFLAEDDFDADTQFCLHWFEQHGWDADVFGPADVLARAKATSVSGLSDAGVIQSGGGKVRLLKWTEYPSDWDPNKDFRTPVWEALHHLIRALKQGGESSAGKVLEGVAPKAEAARQLAYRLYTLCERKGWAEDARGYNELITSWSAIESAAPKVSQQELF